MYLEIQRSKNSQDNLEDFGGPVLEVLLYQTLRLILKLQYLRQYDTGARTNRTNEQSMEFPKRPTHIWRPALCGSGYSFQLKN